MNIVFSLVIENHFLLFHLAMGAMSLAMAQSYSRMGHGAMARLHTGCAILYLLMGSGG